MIFTRDMGDAGRLHRILPVLWVKTPQLRPTTTDKIAEQLNGIQCGDWSSLRFENWDTPPSKLAISSLAKSALALCEDVPASGEEVRPE